MTIFYTTLSICLQCVFLQLLVASDLKSQSAKSVKQVYLEVEFEDASLFDVFEQVEIQTDFRFFFDKKDRFLHKQFNLEKETLTVESLLLALAKEAEVRFRQVNNNISVFDKGPEQTPPLEVSLLADVDISGKITDENGEGLPGASVIEKGTTNGTTTDLDGNYKLNIAESASVVISFVGYITKEVEVGPQSTIDIQMEIDAERLDEVVVIGYGTVKKSDLTGSVVGISAEEIDTRPTSNLASALQGKGAGISVNQRQGAPGSPAQIIIRGANSLSSGVNGPLYVVDGMILDDVGNNLDLNNVESIQVLKDASATAIYGSRGANGVIIITTKRGKAGKTQVGFSTYMGTQRLIKKLDFLEADEFKEFYLAAINNATNNTSIDDDIVNSISNTDWQDEVYRDALIKNYSLDISGGSEKSRYYSSISYFDQEGIINNTDFDRLTIRLNTDWDISDKLKVSNNAQVVNSNNYGPTSFETISNGIAWARPTQPVFDDDGNYTRVLVPFSRTNPVGLTDLQVNDRNTLSILDNLVLDYEIIEGLTAKVNVGTRLSFGNSGTYIPKTLAESGFIGRATKSQSKSVSWLNENTLNYRRTINDHNFDLLGGITLQKSETESISGTGIGFTIDDFEYNNLGAAEEKSTTSAYSDNALLSYLGRLNYSFKDKYFLTLSGRYDGSSRLAEGNKWQFFPSVAVAWNIARENFFNESTTVSNLKLRASFGKTGSQAISPYSTLSRFTTTDIYLDGENPSLGYVPSTIGNTNLGWETTDQYDVGMDLGLFSGKVNIIIDYYKKTTYDLLFNRDVAPSSGYGASVQNVGTVENKGFEFSLSLQNFKKEDFSWNSAYNMSFNRAKVVDLGTTPGGEEITRLAGSPSYFFLIKGIAPYTPYGHLVESLDLDTNEYVRKDLDGDGDIDNDDQTIIGKSEPDFIFGFTNNFMYKGFDLSIFVQGSIGSDNFVGAMSHMTTLTGENNTLQWVYDRAGTMFRAPNADSEYVGTTD